MLLTPLTLCRTRCWLLDLTAWPAPPGQGASVYALVTTKAPARVYIGSTKNRLEARLRQHIARSRRELRLKREGKGPPASSATAVLAPVLAGRSGLIVLRLERVPGGNRRLLRLVELAWMLVATREELAMARRRGPQLEWSGEPGDLRRAFKLARKRRWPGLWLRALKPLCENRCLPDPPLSPAPWRRPGRPKASAQRAAARPAGRQDAPKAKAEVREAKAHPGERRSAGGGRPAPARPDFAPEKRREGPPPAPPRGAAT